MGAGSSGTAPLPPIRAPIFLLGKIGNNVGHLSARVSQLGTDVRPLGKNGNGRQLDSGVSAEPEGVLINVLNRHPSTPHGASLFFQSIEAHALSHACRTNFFPIWLARLLARCHVLRASAGQSRQRLSGDRRAML